MPLPWDHMHISMQFLVLQTIRSEQKYSDLKLELVSNSVRRHKDGKEEIIRHIGDLTAICRP